MIGNVPASPSPPLVQAIEDAIMFGQVRELDEVLSVLAIDDDFPSDLRYGLEALRYYRDYYGNPAHKDRREKTREKAIALIETSYGAELLEKLKRVEGDAAEKQA